MLTYYAAQLGIALSIVDSQASSEVNLRVIQHSDLVKGAKRVFNYVKSALIEDNLEFISLNEPKAKMN